MCGLFPAFCALLFALVTWQVAARGPVRMLDEDLGRTVADSSFPGSVAQFFADLGNASVAVPVLVAAMAVSALLRRRGPRPWLPPIWATLTMAAVPAVVVPLKSWIGRTGPPAMAATGAHDGFFPSGHTATAAVAYGAAALLLLAPRADSFRTPPHADASVTPPHAEPARALPRAALAHAAPHAGPDGMRRRHRHARARACAATAYVLLNAGVATGLVRCGYHWPLDVVGAWCLAGVLLWGLARALTRPVRRPGSRQPRASTAPAAPGR
ncbi:phosphatase PAP2 family protein [Streptomyces hiroshimensis]|uniref:Membrane protein n=1 Tax=Streptomyces hiroshimensis TaxID=66424 RepID=A0ABQ2YEC3_9ACTN|nr:phosphatase PAP2 family protein [Streptomyces hiroshimensis]GGX80356.1 membrane protein [Streptomyces hiroshimensis]